MLSSQKFAVYSESASITTVRVVATAVVAVVAVEVTVVFFGHRSEITHRLIQREL